MLWNSLLKNPVLTLGIIMMGLFLSQVARKEKWGVFKNDRLETSSCRGVIIKIEKKIPGNWMAYCEGNNLAVEVKEITIPEKATNLKPLMYRQLANHMSYVAKIALPDLLERVDLVRFKIHHPKMELNAVTPGKYLTKLATLESPEHIMTHLQSTVQVNEVLK